MGRESYGSSPGGDMDLIGEAIDMRLPEAPRLPFDGLHELSAAVNRADRLEQIYEAAIKALMRSLGADRASILLFDRDMVMRFVASEGLSDGYKAAVEGHSPWSSDTVEAEPILVDDVDIEPSLAPFRNTIRGEGIRALGFIPLLYRSRLLGKFMVYYDEPHTFSDQERMLLQTIANHVAFAIEQKRTENNLLLYRKIFEHAPTGIGVIDLSGHYLEQNTHHRELIGYSSRELRSATPAIHLGEEAFSQVVAELNQSDMYRGEVTTTTKAGEQIEIDLLAFTVRDEDGQPLCFVGMKQDITLRKQAEQRIHEINQELEVRVTQRTAELQRAKDELESFCYSVSHDLRAPLRGMTGAAMMLIEDYEDKLDDQGKEHLRRLAAASSRMAQLIDDLLQYSRLGRKELARESVDLKSIAEKTVEDLRRRNVACSRMSVHISDVPAVEADPQLMELVLYNLFENACKFTKGEAEPRVEFGCDVSSGSPVFFVKDNGVGFDPQYAGKLFLPFERLHLESEFPGTGIGLANVKRILERHGGAIWSESKVNEGAAFFFTIGHPEPGAVNSR